MRVNVGSHCGEVGRRSATNGALAARPESRPWLSCGGDLPRLLVTAEKIALGRSRPKMRQGLSSAITARAEGRDGVADRFAHRDRQHQRRLADRFAAEHHAGLGGALEERRR